MRVDVELLRLISAFGIVWYHSGVTMGRDIAYAGLICFLTLAGYFAANSTKNRSLSSRASKLLIPCFIWSCIYALLNAVRGKSVFPEHFNLISKVLVTPSLHLWFLPFLFFCVVLLDFLKKRVSKATLGVIAGTIATALIALAPEWQDQYFAEPIWQYLHGLPAFLIGVFLGCFSAVNPLLRTFLMLVFWSYIIHFTSIGIGNVGITYLVGFAPCFILLSKSSIIRFNFNVSLVSSTTFGVYLCHPLFLFVCWYLGFSDFLLPALAFLLSTIAVMLGRARLPQILVKHTL
jgi:hypothetical protein